MIRWELLVTSIFITILSLSMVTINNPIHFVINFRYYHLTIPQIVMEDSLTITQNKTGIITEVELMNSTNIMMFNVTSPITLSLKPGSYYLSIIKEINSTDGKLLNTTYNATMTLTIEKTAILLHTNILFYTGIIGTVIGLLVYTIRKLKEHRAF